MLARKEWTAGVARTFARTFARNVRKPERGRGGRSWKKLRDSGRSIAFSSSCSLVPAARSVSSYYRLTRGCMTKRKREREIENEEDRKSAATEFALRSVHTAHGFLVPCFSALPRFPRRRSWLWCVVSARLPPPDRRLHRQLRDDQWNGAETIYVPVPLSFSLIKTLI